MVLCANAFGDTEEEGLQYAVNWEKSKVGDEMLKYY